MNKKLVFIVFFIFCRNFFCIAQNPYQLSWKKEACIAATGVAVAFAGDHFDNAIKPLTLADIAALNPDNLNRLDRSTAYNYSTHAVTISNIAVGACIVGPGSLLLEKRVRSQLLTIGVMYAEAGMFAAFLPSIAKGTVQRTRPFVYNHNAPIEKKLEAEARRSFFSGHTCVAFTSAVFTASLFDAYFPQSNHRTLVWGGSLVAAGLVGAMRIKAGAHFPSDVLVGALVGSAIGYTIPRLHRIRNERLSIHIIANNSVGLLTLNYKFH